MCGTVCKGLAMGCNYHELANDCHAKFNEFDDKTSCLCSVNLHQGDLPDQSQVRSLAMLGAALLYSQQALDSGDHSVKNVRSIQAMLPDELRAAIDEAFIQKGETDEKVT
jgi:hypothetical protein